MLLRRRLLLLFVAVLAVVLGLGVFTLLAIRERDHAQQDERRASLARERVALLEAAYADQETGERGFVITGEATFLEPYESGQELAGRLAPRLRAVLDRPEARRDLTAVTEAARQWRLGAAEPEIARTRASGPAAAAPVVAGGEGKALFDRVRAAVDDLAVAVRTEGAGARGRLDEIRSRLTALFLATVAIAAIGAVVAAWLIRRWVTRPIDRLAGEVRRVRAGELGAPIAVEGPPELAALASDVDAMRAHIRGQLLESEWSRQTLEQSAAVVLSLRSELEPVVGDLPPGWTVSGALRAAEGVVAGDCYDLFVLRDSSIALIVVDIAGHGATEGILALRCKEMLRTALASGSDPGGALATTADVLGNMGDEVFLTAFVAVLDPVDGGVRYANAGHPPAYVVGDDVTPLGPTGPLVGLLTPGWSTAEAVVRPGDNLCVYTDGLIEARNGDAEQFGPDRLVSMLAHSRCDEAAAVVGRCLDEVAGFSPAGLRDDATIVVLCRAEEPSRPR